MKDMTPGRECTAACHKEGQDCVELTTAGGEHVVGVKHIVLAAMIYDVTMDTTQFISFAGTSVSLYWERPE